MTEGHDKHGTKRLFIGTLLPQSDCELLSNVKKDLEPVFADWWKCKLRWVKPEKLHTTWLFLGDCDTQTESALKQKLEATLSAVRSTQMQYDALKIFPRASRPSALVLHPDEIPESVAELGLLIRHELGKYCQKKEDRPFNPHLTLLRFPRDTHKKLHFQQQLDLSKYLPLIQRFDHISLIESHLGNAQEEYQVIADYKLSG